VNLRVAVDARPLDHPHVGGGRYLRELLDAARHISPETQFLERRPPPLLAKTRIGRFAPLPLDRIGPRAEVYLAAAGIVPVLPRSPVVLVIHDLTFETRRWEHTRAFSAGMSLLARGGIRRARLVLAPSEATRRDLLRLHPGAEPRVRVIPYGVGARYAPEPAPGEAERIRARYGLPDGYLLHVGTHEPRKNLPALCRAYLRTSASFPPLVLVGARGWGDAPLPSSSRIRRLGIVPEEDLPALYRRALFLAYPSFEEGFGFPPLEAMACGCPVLASDRGAIPEVVGEAGLLLPPEEAAIERGLRRLVEDEPLRRRLGSAGRARARAFSWERCARETLRALAEAACA
jgi:glycosyltransferase involved in cell wall biosynthesis